MTWSPTGNELFYNPRPGGFEFVPVVTQPTFAFSRKPVAMNSGNLSVVAFLQDEKTKKILQSAYVRLGSPSTTTAGR